MHSDTAILKTDKTQISVILWNFFFLNAFELDFHNVKCKCLFKTTIPTLATQCLITENKKNSFHPFISVFPHENRNPTHHHAPHTLLFCETLPLSDSHSLIIHSFESILFKGLIKPVGKPVNQFEWFVQFPAACRECLTQSCNRKFKNIKSIEHSGTRSMLQEECLCLNTINIDIFTIFMLAEICYILFLFSRTDGRTSVNVNLFCYLDVRLRSCEEFSLFSMSEVI